MIKKVLLASILFISCGKLHSQNGDQEGTVSNTVDSLVTYAKSIWYKDTDSVIVLVDYIKKYSEENGYRKGVAQAYNVLGVAHDIKGDYHQSLNAYKIAVDIFREVGDLKGMASCQYNMGLVLQNDEQFAEALVYVQQAYDYYSSQDLRRDMAMSLMTIGNLYLTNNKPFQDAIAKMKESANISIASGDSAMLCYALNLQGDAYIEYENLPDSSIKAFLPSYKYMNAQSNNWSLGFIGVGLSKAYFKKGMLDSALYFNNLALEKYGIINQKLGFRNTYEIRTKILEESGDYKKAVEAHNMLRLYSDSIYNENRSKQINRMKTEYDTEKKESEIALLSQQATIQSLEIQQKNQWIVIGLVGFVMIGLFALFYIRASSMQKQRAKTELEQRFLRSQLNPHFVSNALLAVQQFMLKNDATQAGIYLAKFSKLMRQILENSRQEYISVEEEKQMLQDYLDIHKLRLGGAFDFEIELEDSIDEEVDMIPPMFVQPFVENAIEHGIDSNNRNGLIKIHFRKEGEFIGIDIIDNGKGLSASPQKENHRSLSTTIIKERINLFNQSLRNKIELVLGDITSQDGSIEGTKVQLKVPFS